MEYIYINQLITVDNDNYISNANHNIGQYNNYMSILNLNIVYTYLTTPIIININIK